MYGEKLRRKPACKRKPEGTTNEKQPRDDPSQFSVFLP